MKARIDSMDCGTGENWLLDVDLPELCGEAVAVAIAAELASISGLDVPDVAPSVLSWVPREDGRTFAFVLRNHDSYFGDLLTVGFVYSC